jgi:hypothetical protein
MRLRHQTLVAVTIILTAFSPVVAGHVTATARSGATDLARVEQLLYATQMSAFLSAARSEAWLDWDTDMCSAPLVGSTGRSFNFGNSCRRHDFGYRNLQLIEHRYGTGSTYWNGSSRKRVDQQFLADMRQHCAGRPWYDRPTCRAWAETFYAAVRTFGGP